MHILTSQLLLVLREVKSEQEFFHQIHLKQLEIGFKLSKLKGEGRSSTLSFSGDAEPMAKIAHQDYTSFLQHFYEDLQFIQDCLLHPTLLPIIDANDDYHRIHHRIEDILDNIKYLSHEF